jgi:tetratricopeptide (TPR) repeat protein
MMGNIYFSLAYAFKKNNPHTLLTRKLVFKGLCHCIDHPVLVDELASMADSDHKQIRELLETGKIPRADHLLKVWGNALDKNPGLADHLSNEQVGDLYHLHSIALFAEDLLEDALEKLETALTFSPENPAMFATAAEIFFKAEEYDNGIHYLNQAVALDSSHAVIWETLGDRLREKALFTDAVTAYEQALLAMPDKLGLFKKIGDCYRETGHLEAAKEAYKMITQNQKIETDPEKSPDPPR